LLILWFLFPFQKQIIFLSIFVLTSWTIIFYRGPCFSSYGNFFVLFLNYINSFLLCNKEVFLNIVNNYLDYTNIYYILWIVLDSLTILLGRANFFSNYFTKSRKHFLNFPSIFLNYVNFLNLVNIVYNFLIKPLKYN
jgi:hypothetical protein